MLKTDAEFHALMERVLTGSEAAAQELFREYEPALLHAIRRRLSKRIRSKFDSLDFAQDVWASFFAALPGERLFNTADDLLFFLTKLAENKVIDKLRQRLKTQKHGVDREQSLDDSHRMDKGQLIGAQQTPSQIVMTQEEWVEFLRKQPLVYRQIFIMLREGRTQEEVAEKLGIDKKTVKHAVERAAPRVVLRERS